MLYVELYIEQLVIYRGVYDELVTKYIMKTKFFRSNTPENRNDKCPSIHQQDHSEILLGYLLGLISIEGVWSQVSAMDKKSYLVLLSFYF